MSKATKVAKKATFEKQPSFTLSPLSSVNDACQKSCFEQLWAIQKQQQLEKSNSHKKATLFWKQLWVAFL